MRLQPERGVTAFFIPPCSRIGDKAVPTGDGRLHEVKFDGYRVQVHKVGSRVIIYVYRHRKCGGRTGVCGVAGTAPDGYTIEMGQWEKGAIYTFLRFGGDRSGTAIFARIGSGLLKQAQLARSPSSASSLG